VIRSIQRVGKREASGPPADPLEEYTQRKALMMEKNSVPLETPSDGTAEEKAKEDVFAVEEVVVEELAIDGICGVY